MPKTVTIAIPVLNGGSLLEEVLRAVRQQRVDRQLEVIVCDSGSTDGSLQFARSYADRVIEVASNEFSHGGTRNQLVEDSSGDHVAFLTQDAVPTSRDWLSGLLSAFDLVENVGLSFGPYLPRSGASLSVSRELDSWFRSFSSDGRPRIDVLTPLDSLAPALEFLGHLGFFTDANGCVARAAWERVPFRHVSYAEDHLLAQDMLRAGFAKVYVPSAAVIHSHDYSPAGWLRRSFDEARAMREIYGLVLGPRTAVRNLRGNVIADMRWAEERAAKAENARRRIPFQALATSLSHHGARTVGALLGAHADEIPPRVVAKLSLEGRR